MALTYLHTLVLLLESRTWNLCTGVVSPDINRRAATLLLLSMRGTTYLVERDFYHFFNLFLTSLLCQRLTSTASTTMGACMTLVIKPLMFGKYKQDISFLFLVHILSVPTLVSAMRNLVPNILTIWLHEGISTRCLVAVGTSTQSLKILFNSLEGNAAVCLIANLASLFDTSDTSLAVEGYKPSNAEATATCVQILTCLTEQCRLYIIKHETNITTDHPIFGWVSGNISRNLLDVLPAVGQQLRTLWSRYAITVLFGAMWSHISLGGEIALPPAVGDQVQYLCRFFNTLMQTFLKYKLEIMNALSFYPGFVPALWNILHELGAKRNYHALLRCASDSDQEPFIDILRLACQTATHLLLVVEDAEIFEENRPFSPGALVDISSFLNRFLFKAIWDGSPTPTKDHRLLIQSIRGLLQMCYDRDMRRPFTPQYHWLVKELSDSALRQELNSTHSSRKSEEEISNSRARVLLECMAHVVDFKFRVRLLREEIALDRNGANPTTHVIIRRGHILNDGFRELARLSTEELKGTIKINFINSHGLREAGIDENGVFKEFLEEVIKEAFDPSLGLFKTTSENHLYPSPTSSVQPEFRNLFDFVGRMFGKAMYEGIVLEIPFAQFFLNILLGIFLTLPLP